MKKLYKILCFYVCVLVLLSMSEEICPACNSSEKCMSSLTQKDCPEDTYLTSTGTLCGCCPQCRPGLKLGAGCSTNDPFRKCAPGLACIKDECSLDRSGCAYTYHLPNFKNLPVCEADGSFAPVQCKGDRITGRCFCYAETGERIYGFAWWRDSHNMTCSCSRLKYKMNKGDRFDNTLHCDTKGNFQPLQCDAGICWCANPLTGEIIKGTRAVPESMWNFLPCYDKKKMGLQYLRPCESAAYAQQIMKKHLAVHGTTNIEYNNIQCDYDGSFGIYIILNGIARCQWRDGQSIPPFQASSNQVSQMNCNCARDLLIFQKAGMIQTLSCNGNGNYNSQQDINGKVFCVDRDGFAVTKIFNDTSVLDCSQCIYYEVKNPETSGKC